MVLPSHPFFPGPVKRRAKQMAEAALCHRRAFDPWCRLSLQNRPITLWAGKVPQQQMRRSVSSHISYLFVELRLSKGLWVQINTLPALGATRGKERWFKAKYILPSSYAMHSHWKNALWYNLEQHKNKCITNWISW